MRSKAQAVARFNISVPEWLPPPSQVNIADDVQGLAIRHTAGYTTVQADVSGLPLEDFLAMPEYQDGRFSALMGFSHLPENACTLRTLPSGPLHPRTFLLLFYRRDALAKLHAANLVPSAEPPGDWDALLDVLRAHATAAAGSLASADGTGAAPAAAAGGGTGASTGSGSGPAPTASASAPPTLPRYGLCLTTHASCGRLGDVFAAIAASVLQTEGTQQGYAFDLTAPPPAAVPLVDSSGWRHAAAVLHRLLSYNAPAVGGNESCGAVSPAFLAGNCLFTVDWDAVLPLMRSPALQVPGMLGVAPLPGSRVVVDRRNDADGEVKGSGPVSCDPQLCAISANHDVLYLNGRPQQQQQQQGAAGNGRASHVAGLDRSNGTAPSLELAVREADAVVQLGLAAAADGQARINRAPYSVAYDIIVTVSYLSAGMNPTAVADIAAMQQLVLSQLDRYRVARQNFTNALRQRLGYAPVPGAVGEVHNCSAFLAARWWEAATPAGAGSLPDVRLLQAAVELADPDAAQAYLQALWHAVHHPNGAPDIQSPLRVNWFKYALSYAALLLLPPAPGSGEAAESAAGDGAVDAAISLLARLFNDTVGAFGEEVVREVYGNSISALPWAPAKHDVSSHAMRGGVLVAVVVSAVVGGGLLVAAAVLLAVLHRTRRRRHRDLLGRVVAPRAGPDTTLLVTDIQNSTVLWEQLPVAVMDVSLKLHHGTVRRLLAKFDGYESATEGDSFIVAFAEPAGAVAFATACQLALLHCDWPPELLAHPDGAPVVVQPADTNGTAAGTDTGVMSGTGGCTLRRPLSRRAFLQLSCTRAPTAFPSGRLQPFRASEHDEGSVSSPQTGDDCSGDGGLCSSSLGPSRDASARALAGHGGAGGVHAAAACALTLPVPLPLAASRLSGQQGPHTAPALPAGPQLEVIASARGSSSANEMAFHNVMMQAAGGTSLLQKPSTSPHSKPSPWLRGLWRSVGAGPALGAAQHRSASRLGHYHYTSEAGLPHGRQATPPFGREVGRCCSEADMTAQGALQQQQQQQRQRQPSYVYSMQGFMESACLADCSWGQVSHPCPNTTWGEALAAAFPPAAIQRAVECFRWDDCSRGPDAPLHLRLPSGRLALVAYRGLRVRMGLHSGLDDPQYVLFNKVGGAFKYYGPFAETAKLVSDTAAGGLIALSAAAFTRLRNLVQRGSGAAGRAAHDALVVYAGHYQLAAQAAPLPGGSGRRPAKTRPVKVPAALAESRILTARASSGSTASDTFVDTVAAAAAAAAAAPAGGGGLGAHIQQLGGGQELRGPAAVVTGALDGGEGRAPRAPQWGGAGDGGAQTAPARRAQPPAAGGSTVSAICLGEVGVLAHDPEPSQALFVAVPTPLLCRLGLSPPLRTFRTAQLGSLSAPIGFIAVVFMKVVGASLLLADMPGPAARALGQLQQLACELLGAAGGYLVEGGDGLVLAAFGRPTAAVEWALDCVAGLREVEWEDELLSHELCAEELQPCNPSTVLRRQQTSIRQGLRIKVGLAIGQATHMLTEASGRLSYRGKVMNRAARIAGIAAAGQVLCSSALWYACQSYEGFCDRVSGVCLGRMNLKGIAQPLEVVQCIRE